MPKLSYSPSAQRRQLQQKRHIMARVRGAVDEGDAISRRGRVVSFDECLSGFADVGHATHVEGCCSKHHHERSRSFPQEQEVLTEEEDEQQQQQTRRGDAIVGMGLLRSKSRGQSTNLASLVSMASTEDHQSLAAAASEDHRGHHTEEDLMWGQFVDVVPPDEHDGRHVHDRFFSATSINAHCSSQSLLRLNSSHPYFRPEPSLRKNTLLRTKSLDVRKEKPHTYRKAHSIAVSPTPSCGVGQSEDGGWPGQSFTCMFEKNDSTEEDFLRKKLLDMHV